MPNISLNSAVDNENKLTLDEIDYQFYIDNANGMIDDFIKIDKTTLKKLETLDILVIWNCLTNLENRGTIKNG